MATNTAFKNEQLEISSTDASIPQLAIQGVTELHEFIEGRRITAESARHLAEVLKKRFRAVSGAAGGVTESTAVTAFARPREKSPSGVDISARTHRHSIRDGILNRFVPIGYQDESGFHKGVQILRRTAGGNQLQPVNPSA